MELRIEEKGIILDEIREIDGNNKKGKENEGKGWEDLRNEENGGLNKLENGERKNLRCNKRGGRIGENEEGIREGIEIEEEIVIMRGEKRKWSIEIEDEEEDWLIKVKKLIEKKLREWRKEREIKEGIERIKWLMKSNGEKKEIEWGKKIGIEKDGREMMEDIGFRIWRIVEKEIREGRDIEEREEIIGEEIRELKMGWGNGREEEEDEIRENLIGKKGEKRRLRKKEKEVDMILIGKGNKRGMVVKEDIGKIR